jgi:hypothetical protein
VGRYANVAIVRPASARPNIRDLIERCSVTYRMRLADPI